MGGGGGGGCILCHDVSNLGVFISRALQRFPPGGDVVEEILHDDHRSLVTGTGLGLSSRPRPQGNQLTITVGSPKSRMADNFHGGYDIFV